MAQKVNVVLVSDLSGAEIEDGKGETVSFALDGVQWELELTNKEADKFRGLFQDYVAVARKTGGRAKRGSGSAKSSNREELQQMREWLRANGHEVSDRGRISQELQDIYRAANG